MIVKKIASLGYHNCLIRNKHFNAYFLKKNTANFIPLTPLSFLKHAASLYPSASAYVYHDLHRTWGEVGSRVQSFASALVNAGIQRGDVVSIMSPNTPPMFEAHFAIPGAGAVIHTINTRLDATTVAYQIIHADSKMVIVDTEFNHIIQEVKMMILSKNLKLPIFISIDDYQYHTLHKMDTNLPISTDSLTLDYEIFIRNGDVNFKLLPCIDEWDAISLNYTSGTTADPRCVISSYRSVYLASISNLIEFNMKKFSSFLLLIPMHNINSWCLPWSLTGNISCIYFMRPNSCKDDMIINIIEKYKIAYLAGSPLTMITMLESDKNVKLWIAGYSPSPHIIRRFKHEFNIEVHNAYGLTETNGLCSSHIPDFFLDKIISVDDLLHERCMIQGKNLLVDDINVIDTETNIEVPHDGISIGEIVIRSNTVMTGYLKNQHATDEVFYNGWLHTGDLGVNHGNGRIELKDRSKDIIISGGENISSIEVENIMLSHPCIREIAVIAKPDDKWGEVPCAFVILHSPQYQSSLDNNNNNSSDSINPQNVIIITEQDLITWSRTKMAAFQTPKQIVFLNELPKTSTGKIQKNLLRKLALHTSDNTFTHYQ